MRTIYKALSIAQATLKAPKSNKNTFGNYNYRSAEDILEAVKPILKELDLAMTLSDKIISVGDKNYVEATVTIFDLMDQVSTPISVTAYAREADDKKGMDVAQITGAASSYARKYALSGMFNIDDNKDPDTNEHTAQRQRATAPKEIQTRNKDAVAEPLITYQAEDPNGSGQTRTTIPKITELERAKIAINEALEGISYDAPVQKKAFIMKVLKKSTIDTIDEANEVMDAVEAETPIE